MEPRLLLVRRVYVSSTAKRKSLLFLSGYRVAPAAPFTPPPWNFFGFANGYWHGGGLHIKCNSESHSKSHLFNAKTWIRSLSLSIRLTNGAPSYYVPKDCLPLFSPAIILTHIHPVLGFGRCVELQGESWWAGWSELCVEDKHMIFQLTSTNMLLPIGHGKHVCRFNKKEFKSNRWLFSIDIHV